MKKRKPLDFWILLVVLILVLTGVIIVFSASQAVALLNFKNMFYFLRSQLASVVIGFIAMIIMSNIDYRKVGKSSFAFFVVSIILLILVRIPGIGHESNGAWRWIYIGPQSFQPSELAKFSVAIFFSYSLSKRPNQLESFKKGFLPYIIMLGVFVFLLLLEPHLSCTIIIILVASIILFCAGAKIKHFIMISIPMVLCFVTAIYFNPYMQARVSSFFAPVDGGQKLDGKWQVYQSLLAIGSGGLWGKGLGRSVQKLFYLPEAYNDFIFSVLAEELGFFGVLAIIVLFLVFIWRGIKVAMNSADLFGTLLSVGITSIIAIQAIFNIAVATSSAPPTGVSLPFLSAGGTSLIFLMCGVGILLNISRYANYERI